MRPLHAALAVLTLAVMSGAIVAGGGTLVETGAEQTGAKKTAEPDGAASDPAREEPVTAAIPGPPARIPADSGRAEADAPAATSPATGGLERIAPRKPLSELALAKPPKPRMPGDWKGTTLFRPIAEESAVFTAMGRSIAIAGVESIPPSQTCRTDGVEWPCGMQARGAVRRWLRGRALVCAVPPEAERAVIVAACRLGKQDVGAWLVSNGWAHASADGPYTEAEEVARSAKLGIFGALPDLSSVPPISLAPAPVAAPADLPSILDLSDEPATPPTGQPAPLQ